jgi:enoyl-CoA hydratase/carnithine racemase
MAASAVDLLLDGPVARITLNRPEVLNAGDPRWVNELGAVVAAVAGRADLRVAVIGGAGRAFCAGVDLEALAAGAMTRPHFVACFLALPATSVAWSKRLLARAFDLDFDAFRREMEAGFRECLASPEHRAAMADIRAGHERRT